MKNSTVILVLAIVISFFKSNAQSASLYRDTSIQVYNGALHLANAWAGGFNCPVFAEIDLNGDGIMDLVIFDAQSYRLSTFINRGTPNSTDYIYAPEYQNKFPPGLTGWIRTYDYDGDGDMDLFSYTNASIDVYRNDYNQQTGLQFTLISNQLNTNYGTYLSNIFVDNVDMPAIIDDNGDGDVDVIALDMGSEFFHHEKNLSEDSLGVNNQFLFHDVDGCWGYFHLSQVININKADFPPNSCPLSAANPFRSEMQMSPPHSSLLLIDMDGDGDKDAIYGSRNGNLLYLKNCGTKDSAYMCYQDTLFPSYTTVDGSMNGAPSPYYFDADNDGNKDLIVANFFATGEDYSNVKFFKNTTNDSTNVFSYITNRFLVDNMIEVGTGAHPVLTDVDGDGLKDLLIANDYYFNVNGNIGKVTYYHNSGTTTNAKFDFVTDDFANLSSYNLTGIYLTFGDLDNDGDQDMIVGLTNGTLDYFINNGGAYTLMQSNYQAITVNNSAVPQIVDVDLDGLPDLLIGNWSGTISYYRNTGSLSSPVFTLTTASFGGVNVSKWNATSGFSVPLLYNNNGIQELLVGSLSGYIYQYTNITGNLNGNFTLTDSMFQNIYEPQKATPAMADLNGDGKFDLVIGNLAGGVVYYSSNSALSVPENLTSELLFTLYPNPANETITIKTGNLRMNQKAIATIYDVLGNKVISIESLQEMIHLDIRKLNAGAYLCTVNIGNRNFSQRFIKK